MARVLIAQIGARRHYAVPRALYRSGFLEALVTDACADIAPWRWLGMIVPEARQGSGMRRLMGRSVPEVPRELIKGLPLFNLGSYPGLRRGEKRTDYWARRNAAFGRGVVRRGLGDADTVYAFNGAALEIFEAAKRQGLRTVLDQTAAPWRWNARLLREEIARWPNWEDRPAELDESGQLSEREEAEWALADAVVCGSEFCRSTLIGSGVPGEKIHVLRTAFTGSSRVTQSVSNSDSSAVLRVLFVGTLQLRKGIPYLYEAARKLRGSPFKFRLVGDSLLSGSAQRKLGRICECEGPVPRSQISAHYQWADVLVLPTLSEGAANVCNEAMAAGLPVITTKPAGSAVQDRVNGILIPERNSGSLGKALEWMAADPDTRHRLGAAANRTMATLSGERDFAQRLHLVLNQSGIRD